MRRSDLNGIKRFEVGRYVIRIKGDQHPVQLLAISMSDSATVATAGTRDRCSRSPETDGKRASTKGGSPNPDL